MLEPLDIRTMLQMGALTCLLLAVVMVYHSIARKTYSGFHYWTLGIVSVGIGAVLVSLRGVLPDFITIIIGNILIAFMPVALTYGISKYFEYKWRLAKLNIALLLLFTSLFLWWTYISPNLYARVICLSFTLAVLLTESLRVLIISSKNIFNNQEWILIAFLVFSIASLLFRIFITIRSFNSFSFLQSSGIWHSIAILGYVLGVVGIACSFLIVNSHRIEKNLINANERIKKLANIDGLTNLFNRRYFDEKLKYEFKRLQRSSQSISLLMADIDCFKLYNDNYGHQLGDICLKEIASIFIEAGGRISDIAARYGGEELALLLPGADSDGAQIVAKAILHQLKAKAIPHKASPVSDMVTLSVGIATVRPDSKMQPDDLIKYADQALYESKRNGKNQIRLYA